jgi:hypothetical protein
MVCFYPGAVVSYRWASGGFCGFWIKQSFVQAGAKPAFFIELATLPSQTLARVLARGLRLVSH